MRLRYHGLRPLRPFWEDSTSVFSGESPWNSACLKLSCPKNIFGLLCDWKAAPGISRQPPTLYFRPLSTRSWRSRSQYRSESALVLGWHVLRDCPSRFYPIDSRICPAIWHFQYKLLEMLRLLSLAADSRARLSLCAFLSLSSWSRMKQILPFAASG